MLSSVSVEVSTKGLAATEDSIAGQGAGRGMDPSKGSGQGPSRSEGYVPVKGFVLGKDLGRELGRRSFPSEGSVALEGCSVPNKDSSRGSGEGSSHFQIDGSVPGKGPVALDGSVPDQRKGHGTISGPRGTGMVSGVPVDQEFPIMTRFRFRRLLAFLACTRFTSAFQALQTDVSVFLDLVYLQRLVSNLMWDDAKNYLLRVLPYECMGVEGRTLVDFLVNLMFMYAIAHGHHMASQLIETIERRCRVPTLIRDGNYTKVLHTILSMRSQQVRPSIDWHLVGLKAAEIIRDLITQTPEFSDFLTLPSLASDLHDVINVFPHGFGSRRICRVKKAARVPVSVIAKHFLPEHRFQDAGQGKIHLGLLADPSAWLRSSIDEALKAGTRTVLHRGHRAKYAYNEGMDRKRSLPNVSQSFDAGNYPKRRQISGTQISYIPGGGNRTA